MTEVQNFDTMLCGAAAALRNAQLARFGNKRRKIRRGTVVAAACILCILLPVTAFAASTLFHFVEAEHPTEWFATFAPEDTAAVGSMCAFTVDTIPDGYRLKLEKKKPTSIEQTYQHYSKGNAPQSTLPARQKFKILQAPAGTLSIAFPKSSFGAGKEILGQTRTYQYYTTQDGWQFLLFEENGAFFEVSTADVDLETLVAIADGITTTAP